jgi:ATP-dependent DNA helicase DinG
MTALLADLFSAAGPLAAGVPGYRPRPQQLELAERIAAAIADHRVLVAEAGTGTGKTYAYLVPALLSSGKVIVSTGTRNLQDQLFTRDIPTIRKALKSPVRVALLKGRANYLCHYHLERSLADGRFLSRSDAVYAQRIARFARKTRSGDKAECADVPENATVWAMVTSTRDNCLGQECPHHKECFVLAARREALAADLVVVNHHLFFADVMLRDEGTAELLPACNTVIFDEAHQLPEVASLFFGDSISTSQVLELVRDAQFEGLASARDCLDLPLLSGTLEKAVRDLRLTLPVDAARYAVRQLEARPDFTAGLGAMINAIEALATLLETQAQRAEGLENCWRRATALGARLLSWQSGGNAGFIRWGETFSHSLQLNATPLAIAETMQKQMSGHPRAWIFTSATLAVQDDFAHYCGEMGLADACSARWESPFDYPRQALLYVPRNLPDPNQPALCRGGRACRISGHQGEWRARLFPVHLAARHAPDARTARRVAGPRRTRAASAVAGGEQQERIARTFSPSGQRHPDRQPEFLGRRRCARRSALAGDHRQAAVCPAGRPGALGASRKTSQRGPQCLSWSTSCRAP